VAGVVGVIYSPGGQLSLSFSWSIGEATNNQAEAYAIFKGLGLAQNQGIKDISILGNSWMIINLIRKPSPPQDMKLKNIMVRVLQEIKSFESFHCSYWCGFSKENHHK
jgi:ribonuclease HI